MPPFFLYFYCYWQNIKNCFLNMALEGLFYLTSSQSLKCILLISYLKYPHLYSFESYPFSYSLMPLAFLGELKPTEFLIPIFFLNQVVICCLISGTIFSLSINSVPSFRFWVLRAQSARIIHGCALWWWWSAAALYRGKETGQATMPTRCGFGWLLPIPPFFTYKLVRLPFA